LRQLSSGLIHTGAHDNQAFILSERRFDELESIIESVQGPVLVAAFYKAEVNALLRRLGSRARAFVGDTPGSERIKLIQDWNNDQIDVLIAAPGAMGHGINLQLGSARTIVWLTHTYDWAQRAQFNARLVRSGQTKVVSIISMVGDIGIDRAVLCALNSKQSGERAILDALDLSHRYHREQGVEHVSA
jgi:hypothetical protein